MWYSSIVNTVPLAQSGSWLYNRKVMFFTGESEKWAALTGLCSRGVSMFNPFQFDTVFRLFQWLSVSALLVLAIVLMVVYFA